MDPTLRDITRLHEDRFNEKALGGKSVIRGDFRQILSIIPRASREEVVNSTISSSKQWVYCKVIKLTNNIRLHVPSSISTDPMNKYFVK